MVLIVQDESVRLWNVHTGICILVFAGAGGHRNEVLSVVRIRLYAFICFNFPTSYSIFQLCFSFLKKSSNCMLREPFAFKPRT